MHTEVVIVINPGSTSTKIALFTRSGEICAQSIKHEQSTLDSYKKVADQLDYRFNSIWKIIKGWFENAPYHVVGVVGRGGIVKPLEGGTYRVNPAFIDDAFAGTFGEHASNLGVLLAKRIKEKFGLSECYSVDPVSVSNITPIAEISGVPGILRSGRGHPLNMKMTARKIAILQNIPFDDTIYVIAHLGGGISIALVHGGNILDVNDALLGMGPFSPNRAGALPLRGVMELCYNNPKEDVEKLLSKNSGLKAYLGTEDLREVIELIDVGNEQARLIYNAFVYQIAKEIGAYFAASKGKAHAIIITGGIAYNERFISDLKGYVGNLTKFHVYAGENEMEALAEGIFRIIDVNETAKEY